MKSRFRILKGNILVFAITNSVWFFSLFMVNPYISLYVLALGGTATTIGFVGVFRQLAGLFAYPVAGQLTDTMNRVKVIGVSRILHSLMFAFHIFAINWQTLAVGDFLLGLMIFHYAAESAVTADSLPPEQRASGFATLNVISRAAAILAPYAGAYIITLYGVNLGTRYLYTVTLICGVTMAGILRLKFLKETLKHPKARLHLRDVASFVKRAYRGVWETLKWMPRSLKVLTLIMAVNLFFNRITGPFWIVYGVNVIKLTELDWGLLMLLIRALIIVLYIPAGMIIDKVGSKRAIVAALAFSVLPVSLFVYCTTFLQTLIVFLAITVANAFLLLACSTLLTNTVPREKRGRVISVLGQGVLQTLIGGGAGGGPGVGLWLIPPGMIGSLVSGYVYSFNPTYPWVLFSLSLIVCLILAIFFVKRVERPEP